MSHKDRLSGNEAIAYAIKQISPDVIAAFPITPSTEIPQYISQFIADGKLDTEFITVESEHSAISACAGAQAAGVRAMTATSSAGFALMHEMLYVIASYRLPIVMAVANRALTGPININNDHSDTMGSRDCGWIQLYSENAQEAYDNMLMAHRIAENTNVLLPIMVCQDGFITSHAVENIILEDDSTVKKFIGAYRPEHYLLNPKESISVGAYGTSSYYMELKKQQSNAMVEAKKVIKKVSQEFANITGRYYDLIETYQMEDARFAVVCIGSSAGTAKSAIDALRERGIKAGVVKIRVFRPFPSIEIASALSHVKAVGIMDKSDSFSGNGGPVSCEIRSAMYQYNDNTDIIPIMSYIYGLGGRDVRVDDFYTVFSQLEKSIDKPIYNEYSYIGVRE